MIDVILNPKARGGAGARLRQDIERELSARGAAARIAETRERGHATALAMDAVRRGATVVVAAGGDGTIHEVANGILRATEDTPDAAVALGIIPIGTGNDFVKVVPGTSTLALACDTIASGVTLRVDVGVAAWGEEQEYFVNAIGTGVDVEVVRQIERLSRSGGGLAYIRGLLRALRIYAPIGVRVVADGEETRQRVMNVAIANGRSVGGAFRIAPRSSITDGRLDLCIIEEVPALSQLLLAARMLRGTHESSSRVRTSRIQHVELYVEDGPLFFQLDGELREPKGITHMTVRVVPSRLNVKSAAVAPATAHNDSERLERFARA